MLDPSPHAGFVGPILVAELALQVRLFACDHAPLHEREHDREEHQRPHVVHEQGEAEVERGERDVHRVAGEPVGPSDDERRGGLGGIRRRAGLLEQHRGAEEEDERPGDEYPPHDARRPGRSETHGQQPVQHVPQRKQPRVNQRRREADGGRLVRVFCHGPPWIPQRFRRRTVQTARNMRTPTATAPSPLFTRPSAARTVWRFAPAVATKNVSPPYQRPEASASGTSARTGGTPATPANGGTTARHTRNRRDRKTTRLNSSHSQISYAVFCLKKKKKKQK